MGVLDTIINGLSMGSIYALIALGYTMVYGIAKMLNFAHGDVIMVGAYSIFVTMGTNGSPILAVLLAVLVCVVLGVTIESVAYKPLRGSSPLAVLITAIGVSYLLQSVSQLIFGATQKPIVLVNWSPVVIGSLTIKAEAILTLCVAAFLMIVLTIFIKKTSTGRAMLAVSEDKGAAQLMGINVNKTIAITFAIGSALAAFASVFYLMQIPLVGPTMGAMPGIKAFVAAVLGGIGSLPGAMLGGLVLGLVEQFGLSSAVLAPFVDAIVFSIMIVVLLVKPTGILGKKRYEKV